MQLLKQSLINMCEHGVKWAEMQQRSRVRVTPGAQRWGVWCQKMIVCQKLTDFYSSAAAVIWIKLSERANIRHFVRGDSKGMSL